MSSYTSPFKAETIKNLYPSVFKLTKLKEILFIEEQHSDSDNFLYTPFVDSDSPSMLSLQVKTTTVYSEYISEDKN